MTRACMPFAALLLFGVAPLAAQTTSGASDSKRALGTEADARADGAPVDALDALAFMAGCWRGEFGEGAALEEYYSTPTPNLIVGVSRFLRNGRAVQHEFSRITADSTGVALLPFPGGRMSEHAFRLTHSEAGSALFEAPEHDFPKRIRYTHAADGSLTARIDGGEGSARVQEWRMLPVACNRR